MIEIPHKYIRESIPIMYTFYGCYNIDRRTEGPYLSYNYVILTLSPGVGDSEWVVLLNGDGLAGVD